MTVTQSETPAQEEARKLREREHEKLDAQIERCIFCDYTGFVVAERHAEGGVNHKYSFRCHACKAAELKGLSQNIPIWQDQPGFLLRTYPHRRILRRSGDGQTRPDLKAVMEKMTGVEIKSGTSIPKPNKTHENIQTHIKNDSLESDKIEDSEVDPFADLGYARPKNDPKASSSTERTGHPEGNSGLAGGQRDHGLESPNPSHDPFPF